MRQRLEQQLRFILEIDNLKHVLRRSRLIAVQRFENSAEHSWHIAVMALLLAETSNEPVDLLRTVKMLLIHDIVEIDAEEAAAARIFGLLPDDQRDEMLALWQEFEARTTPEARFANAMDRLMPVLHNLNAEGGSWRDHNVTLDQVITRVSPIGDGSSELWEVVQMQLNEAVQSGLLAA